ncbi:MAG: hypothetical protein QXP53_01230 [Candidatus Pacearchaeota archaeon]
MKKKGFLTALISLLIFSTLIGLVSAECITIHLAQQEYLPRETLQAEIDAQITRDLTTNDLFLYRGNTMLPNVFFLTKVTPTKYFIWTNLPSIESNYLLKVRGYCPNGITIAQQEFQIKKPITSLYESLPKENFRTLNLNDHIAVAAATYLEEIKRIAEYDFIARSDSCYTHECTSKQLALASIAFPTIRDNMLDKLVARQNSISNGSWKIEFDSTEQTCNLKINASNTSQEEEINLSGKQNITLDLSAFYQEKEITVAVNCSHKLTTSLFYKYKTIEKKIEEKQDSTLSFLIKNYGCWGSGFKTACDEESTVYSVLALYYLGKAISNQTIEWLGQHQELIMSKAAYYALTKNNETLNFLLANEMYSGGWPQRTGSYVTDIQTTSLVYFFLQQKLIKSENRLLTLFTNANLNERSHILFLVFTPEKIAPVVSFWPGMIKTESQGSFSVIIKNDGLENLTGQVNFMNSSSSFSIGKSSTKSLTIGVPKITTPTKETIFQDLELVPSTSYGNTKIYTIPVMILTDVGIENITGQTNVSQQDINETQEQNIINETQNQSIQNQTTNINYSLLQGKFRFVEASINRTITEKENFTISLRLLNRYDKEISDITIVSTTGLLGLIEIDPSRIEKIDKDETKQITIKITPTFSSTYSGSIIAQGKIGNETVSTNISVLLTIRLNETRTCQEMNGTDCSQEGFKCDGQELISSDTFHCCLGECKKEKKSSSLPIIIIVVVMALLVTAYIILKRKPKKEMRDVLEEVQKKYEARYAPGSETQKE